MKQFILALILIITFSFNSCSDSDDDDGNLSQTFTEKYEMTVWQRQGRDIIYMRFEKGYPFYAKTWTTVLGPGCYFETPGFEYKPEPVFTVLEKREDYFKYHVEYVDSNGDLREYEMTFSYKNGIMNEEDFRNDRSAKRIKTEWEKSSKDLSTLNLCE